MLKGLLKTPLMAVFFAALFYYSGIYLPYSQPYRDASSAFTTPLIGHLTLLGFALLLSIVFIFALSSLRDRGIVSVVLLFISMTGFLWILPSLSTLWKGDPEQLLTNGDVLLNMIRGTGCTLLLLILAVLLHPRDKSAAKAPPTHRLKAPGFIIKLLVLPFIYFFLYLADWYFLNWNNDALRVYSGGPEARENLVTAIINLFLSDPVLPAFILISGLIIVVFLLPLMLKMPDKKTPFILLVLLFTLSAGLFSLIPAFWLRPELQFPLFIRNTALSVFFGVVAAILLHSSYKKLPADPARPAAASPRAAGQRPPQVAGVSAKQAASAVQSTMHGA